MILNFSADIKTANKDKKLVRGTVKFVAVVLVLHVVLYEALKWNSRRKNAYPKSAPGYLEFEVPKNGDKI